LLDPGPRLDPYVLDFVKALSRSDAAQVESFVAVYKEGKPAQDRLERLLYLIGFMGPKAESAAPFLMEQLRTYESDPETSSAIMVVLANVNPAQSDIVGTVRRQIAARSENAYPAIWTLSIIGPGEWVDQRVASDLVKWLEEPRNDADVAAASVLGRLREKGKLGLVRLKGLLAAAEQDKRPRTCRIGYGMALAKIDSNERQLFLRRVFKYAGGPEGRNHTDWAMLRCSVFALEPDMVDAVVQLIGDKDPDVVLGAASMVFYIGMEARGAGPALMSVLESRSEDTVKARAAQALAVVGDQSYVPRIQQLLGKESDSTVKENLTVAIRVLSEYGGRAASAGCSRETRNLGRPQVSPGFPFHPMYVRSVLQGYGYGTQ
jgi:hypothetical protein